jgi:hypothetical protein
MRYKLRIAVLSIVLLGGLFLASAFWIAGRESTLQWATKQAVARSGGALEISGVQGSIYGPVRISHLTYQNQGTTLALDDVLIKWSPLSLLRAAVSIELLHIDSAALSLPAPTREPPNLPQSLAAPVRVSLHDAKIDRFSLTREGKTQQLGSFRFELHGSRSEWKGDIKSDHAELGDAIANFEVAAHRPFALNGKIQMQQAEAPTYSASVTLGGSLQRIEAAASAQAQGAKGEATAALTPFDTNPVQRLDLNATGINPQSWQSNAPIADLSLQLKAEATTGNQLKGGITLRNNMTGTLDQAKLPLRSATAELEGDLANIALSAVNVDLGQGGQFAGSGALRGDSLMVNLATSNVDLRGLQSKLHATHLAGNLKVMTHSEARHIQVDLKQNRYRFELDAVLADDRVTLNKARARAASSQLLARGTIAFDGNRAFDLSGNLVRFNPAQFGDYSDALLNTRFHAAGEIAPVLKLAADLKVFDSRAFGEPVSLAGKVRSKDVAAADVAVNLKGRVGDTYASAAGTLIDPAKLKRLDLNLELRGQDLAKLYPILGVPIPPTAQYRLAGRLLHEEEKWEFMKFNGSVGNSDLAGDFVVDRSYERQLIQADLVSGNLDIKDLAGFIGASPKTQPAKTASPSRVLPDEPFSLEKLHSADADIKFRGKRIVTTNLPLDDISAHLRLHDGWLTLKPLNFGVAEGQIASDIVLDARKPIISTAADATVKNLKLNKLFPNLKTTQASAGEISGHAILSATGNSVAQMLGSANGEAALIMNGGTISDLLLRLSNLDIGHALPILVGGDKTVPVRCMVADFRAVNGDMRAETLVLDTANTNVTGEGNINFKDESLNLKLVAKPKDNSLVALRGPIRVKGSFNQPSVRPELTGPLGRAGAAAALGAVGGPLAVVPLIQLRSGKDADCDALIAGAEQNVEAIKDQQQLNR